MKMLFVCLGNICRSPAAEAVLRARAPFVQADSAGVMDWHIGKPPYAPMIAAAAARGYAMDDLRGRQFTAADFDAFDVIFAMDASNLIAVEAKRPAGNTTPVMLFSGRDVPDPYDTRDFDGCLDIIEATIDALLTADTTARPAA